jgi:hypothetical protein
MAVERIATVWSFTLEISTALNRKQRFRRDEDKVLGGADRSRTGE